MPADCGVDGCVEDLLYAAHLLGGALHVHSAHLLSNGFALLLSDWCQTLCLEKLDTGSLVTEIGFEATEDDWSRGAEMENLRVPLRYVSYGYSARVRCTYLIKNILQRVWAVDSEAYEEKIGLWV